jgi:hypothetical protein
LWETETVLWKLCGPRRIFSIELKSQHPNKRSERIKAMSITDWIIQISIFGVLALAVAGTVQNLFDAMKKKN